MKQRYIYMENSGVSTETLDLPGADANIYGEAQKLCHIRATQRRSQKNYGPK